MESQIEVDLKPIMTAKPESEIRETFDRWHAPNCTIDAGGGCLLDSDQRDAYVAGWRAAEARWDEVHRENSALSRMYALCEQALRERTGRLNELETLVRAFAQTPVDDAEFGALYRRLVAW